MSEMNGYINLTASKIVELCKESINHIETIKEARNKEFIEWAIPYFNKTRCRQKWWQFFRRPPFVNEEDFKQWFYHQYRCIGLDQEEDFAEVSVMFRDSTTNLCFWYPSTYARGDLEIIKSLLKQASKLDHDKLILLSLENYRAIS